MPKIIEKDHFNRKTNDDDSLPWNLDKTAPNKKGRDTMYGKIDHVAIVVKNLEEALKVYKDDLGFTSEGIASFPEIGIRQAFLPIGESYIHLVEPADPKGEVARYIENRGEGLYLLAVTTDDIKRTIGELKEKGARVIGDDPDNLARGGLVMVHPRSAKGVLLQLIEKENKARQGAIRE
jgi:methylmalonyl-CoA epimerase